jgi:hypothetical protein
MPVYSFGVQMAVLLLAFLPATEAAESDSSTEPGRADTRKG